MYSAPPPQLPPITKCSAKDRVIQPKTRLVLDAHPRDGRYTASCGAGRSAQPTLEMRGLFARESGYSIVYVISGSNRTISKFELRHSLCGAPLEAVIAMLLHVRRINGFALRKADSSIRAELGTFWVIRRRHAIPHAGLHTGTLFVFFSTYFHQLKERPRPSLTHVDAC